VVDRSELKSLMQATFDAKFPDRCGKALFMRTGWLAQRITTGLATKTMASAYYRMTGHYNY